MKKPVFGLLIKEMRTKKGIPQRLLAYALNIYTSTYSKMELGERQISIEIIEAFETDFKPLMVEYSAI